MRLAIAEMAFRDPIKGFIVFSLLIGFIGWGTVALYPAFEDAMLGDISSVTGTELLQVTLNDEDTGNITISWVPINETIPFIPPGLITNYSVRESLEADVDNGTEIYKGGVGELTLLDRTNRTHYYGLYIHFEDPLFGELAYPIANVSTEDLGTSNPYAKLLENPAMKAFAGTTAGDADVLSLKWFILIEFYSYMLLVIAMYLAYLASGLVAKDVENKTADLFLSTPIPRWRYVLEKFLAISVISVLMALVVTGAIWLGVASAGSDEVSFMDVLATNVAAIPLMLAFASFSLVFSILLDEQKKAMGASFAFIFLTYAFHLGANISEDLEALKGWLPFNYVDFANSMVNATVDAGDAAILLLVTAGVLLLSLALFERKEIYI